MVTKKHTWLQKFKQNHEQENFTFSNNKSYFDDYLHDVEVIQRKSNGVFLYLVNQFVWELCNLKGVSWKQE